MKEYTYQLEKDDYREWIQWNIKKHDQKKVRYITAVSYTHLDVYKRQDLYGSNRAEEQMPSSPQTDIRRQLSLTESGVPAPESQTELCTGNASALPPGWNRTGQSRPP